MKVLPPETRRDLILSVGTHKAMRPLTPAEVAEAMETELTAGTSREELVQELLLEDASMVGRFLNLLKLSPQIRHLVDWGQGLARISFSTASEVARLPTSDDQIEVAEAILRYGFSKMEVKQIIQIRQRSFKSCSECINEVLRLRPQFERLYVLIGAVSSQDIRSRLKEMSQRKRDEILRNVIDSNVSGLPNWDGKLGVERFTIVGDEQFGGLMLDLPGGFEKAINSYMETVMS